MRPLLSGNHNFRKGLSLLTFNLSQPGSPYHHYRVLHLDVPLAPALVPPQFLLLARRGSIFRPVRRTGCLGSDPDLPVSHRWNRLLSATTEVALSTQYRDLARRFSCSVPGSGVPGQPIAHVDY